MRGASASARKVGTVENIPLYGDDADGPPSGLGSSRRDTQPITYIADVLHAIIIKDLDWTVLGNAFLVTLVSV